MKEDICKYYQNLSDSDLIECILHNDSQAVEYLLYVKCKPMITRLAWQLFSNNINEDELIGEFFIFLQKNDWAKLKTFEGKSALCTWLTIVATRFFIKNKPRLTNFISDHTLTINEMLNNMLTTTTHTTRSVTKYELWDAIQKLKETNHRWVLMGELNGMSAKELAEELHTTIFNIYNYRKRAKIELVKLLNEEKNV